MAADSGIPAPSARARVGLPLRVDYDTPPVDELGQLAAAHELTPYDAVYLELARRRKLPLATLDAALIKTARAAKLALLTKYLSR